MYNTGFGTTFKAAWGLESPMVKALQKQVSQVTHGVVRLGRVVAVFENEEVADGSLDGRCLERRLLLQLDGLARS